MKVGICSFFGFSCHSEHHITIHDMREYLVLEKKKNKTKPPRKKEEKRIYHHHHYHHPVSNR